MPDIVQAGQNYADAAGRLLTGRANIEANRLTGKTNALLGAIEPITKALTPLNEDQKLAQRMTIEDAKARRQAVIDAAADQAAVKAAFQTHTDPDGVPDFKGVINSLYSAGRTKAASTINDAWIKMRKDASDQENADLTHKNTEAQMLAQTFGGDMNETSYPIARRMAIGLDPTAARLFPEQWGPDAQAVVERAKSAGTSVAEQNRLIKEATDRLIEGKTAQGAAAAMARSASPEDWQNNLAKVALFDADEYRKWKAVPFSPEAVKAANDAALTPEQRISNEDRRVSLERQDKALAASVANTQADNARADAAALRDTERLRLQQSADARAERNAAREANGQKPLTANAESNLINRLTTQWTASTKPARDLERQAKLMHVGLEEARKGNKAAGSQAVLVTFQKILDPTSVVRESEYMRSAAGLSLINRIQGAVERLAQGGAGVPLPELEKFATLADEAVKAQTGSYLQSIKDRIGRTADHYNIPRELIFEDVDVLSGKGATATPDLIYDKATGTFKKGGG